MYGRYGYDELNRALMILALILLAIGWIGGIFVKGLSVFGLLAYVPLVWSLIRSWSKNIEARTGENTAYLRIRNRMKDRNNRYFRCPRCRQMVRVPKGKGKINIRCPRCEERFIRKS